MNKYDLEKCIIEALKAHKGEATILQVCKFVWDKYISKLEKDNNLFYTWGYDIRWAGQRLRDNNKAYIKSRGVWALK